MASLNWKRKRRLKVHDDGEAWNLWRWGLFGTVKGQREKSCGTTFATPCPTFCCLTQVTIQWDGQGVGLKSARRVAKGTEIEEFLLQS